MKRFFALALVMALTVLCGCAGGNEVSEVSEVSQANISDFAATTLMSDDVLEFRIVSAKPEGVGVTYAIEFTNKTYYPIQVNLSDISVNDQPLETTLSLDVGKNATQSASLTLKSDQLEVLGIEKAEKVGLHVKVINTERWSAPAMTERDLVFYTPLAPTVATATATATAA